MLEAFVDRRSNPDKTLPLRELLEEVKDKVAELDPMDAWSTAMRREVAAPAFQRDPDYLKKLVPLMGIMARYFDAEVRGLEHVPESPVLIVGNHSGGALTPDTSAVIHKWYTERGYDDPLVGLAFDAAFSIPGFKDLMRKIGQVPASMKNAQRALEQGASVIVYPGGVYEVFRPWHDRNRVDFNGHKGFIKCALRAGVRVVPVVGHGGHETLMVLSRGEKLAKLMKMDRIRMSQYPILFQFPWGLSTAVPGIPLPAKINVQFLEPLDWAHYGPEAADDQAVLDRCYEEITDVMQATLTRLAQENPRPLLSRIERLLAR